MREVLIKFFELFNNIREIKVFNKEKFISKYFSKFNYNFSDTRKYDFSVIVLRNYVEIAVIIIIIFSSLFF